MSKIAHTTLAEADALESALATWRKTVEAELKGAPFEKKLLTKTFEGITLKPLYTRADLAGRESHLAAMAKAPGEAPYLRGTRAGGYAAGAWEVAQEIAAGTAEEFNSKLREDLMGGQNAAVLRMDTPARPEGLPLEAPGTLETALKDVDLAAIPVHINAGVDATKVAAHFIALAALRGVDGSALRGSLTADPLNVWAAAGSLPMPLPAAHEALAAWTKRAAVVSPSLRTVGVDARLWAEAGGSAVLELACALASVVEYVRELRDRGVPIEIIVPRIRVTFGAGPQFLMETAKFRAWRPLLVRAVVALGGKAELAAQSAVNAATTRWDKTRLDPHVNMLRATTEAFSAVLGGVDSLHIAPFDSLDGIGGGDAFSRRIARNVHALLAEEFGATAPADPAGGSWCVESLTDELARLAWAEFQRFEVAGGFAAALRAGLPQKLAAATAAEKAKAVGTRRLGIVGTNLFPNLKETPLPALAKRPVTGAWTEERVEPAVCFRAAAAFEKMRDASAGFARRTGKPPRVFLAKMGPVLQHKARADFAAGFFSPGGFEIVAKQTFVAAEEAAKAASDSGAEIAVLCSTDETYPELAPAFAKALKAAKPSVTVVLAGMPADKAAQDAFTAAGFDLFIHLRAPVEETLTNLLKKIGAL
jgi:Methylmalonyl-CoA mutase, N-terminal domain/subunit